MFELSNIRKTSLKGAIPLLAITAALSASPAEATTKVRARAIATKICHELYDTTGSYLKGVPVEGILNGFVTLKDRRTDSKVTYRHPVILTRRANTAYREGSWIGVPVSGPDGHTCLRPVKINEGTHGAVTETVHITHAPPILNVDALVSAHQVTGSPDQLLAFGASGEFPLVPITASVDK